MPSIVVFTDDGTLDPELRARLELTADSEDIEVFAWNDAPNTLESRSWFEVETIVVASRREPAIGRHMLIARQIRFLDAVRVDDGAWRLEQRPRYDQRVSAHSAHSAQYTLREPAIAQLAYA